MAFTLDLTQDFLGSFEVRFRSICPCPLGWGHSEGRGEVTAHPELTLTGDHG